MNQPVSKERVKIKFAKVGNEKGNHNGVSAGI